MYSHDHEDPPADALAHGMTKPSDIENVRRQVGRAREKDDLSDVSTDAVSARLGRDRERVDREHRLDGKRGAERKG